MLGSAEVLHQQLGRDPRWKRPGVAFPTIPTYIRFPTQDACVAGREARPEGGSAQRRVPGDEEVRRGLIRRAPTGEPRNFISKAGFSVKAFGIYLLALGVGLALMPNQLLGAFGMPRTEEVWIRVVGVLVFNIGLYHLYAARGEAKGVFWVSVYTRVLVLFGPADFAGAVWTFMALRAGQAARR